MDSGHWVTKAEGYADCPAAYNEDGSLREDNSYTLTDTVEVYDNSHHPKPAIIDAYAEHVAKLRERRAQEPEDEKFDLTLSRDAIDFIAAAMDLVRATTKEGEKIKEEIADELLSALRTRIREQEAQAEARVKS